MKDDPVEEDGRLDVRHPLIRQIGALTAEAVGVRLLIVYPNAAEWEQVYSDEQPQLQPAYCRMIKSTREGARQCRMCHVLMAVAACHGGPTVQYCHSGVSVLVCPASPSADESVAVLSSCLYRSEEAWGEARKRGKELGLNQTALRKAFSELPHLNDKQLRILKSAMQAMSLAIQVVRGSERLHARERTRDALADPAMEVKRFVRNTRWAGPTSGSATPSGNGRSRLVHVVHELVRQRPDLPLTVKELATAARLTPNHFTALFHERTGKSFSRFLTEQRMDRAKKLLMNPALSVAEIARMVGYDDPGYFARRFRQTNGCAPGAWRNR